MPKRRTPSEGFAKLFRDVEKTDEYWTELAKLEFTEEMARLMRRKRVTQSELARRMGVCRQRVFSLLRGDYAPTLATVAKVARALDCNVKIHLEPRGKKKS